MVQTGHYGSFEYRFRLLFLATTISRLLTQVWFDPYLVYKYVFKKKPWRYYGTYVLYLAVAAAACFSADFIAQQIIIPYRYVSFILKGIVAVVVPNLIIIILFRKTKEYTFLKQSAIKFVLRHKKKET